MTDPINALRSPAAGSMHAAGSLDPATSAIATGLRLPDGFAELAQDPSLGPAITTGLARVEKQIRDAVAHTDPLADATSRHLVEAGGKRIRPLLTILASYLGDGPGENVLKAATVMELTHLATLYHDDVMDSAPVRRGAPTAHEVWGNSVAILTGDLIFARSSLLVADLGASALRIQARTFERLVLGQLHETVGPVDGEDPVDHYIGVLADKTASLVAASGQLGALLSGAGDTAVNTMINYGEKVGVAFQLADDVIDVAGLQHKSGKTPGTDLRERVPTLPILLLRQAAAQGDAAAVETLTRVDGNLDDDADLAAAVAAVRAHPATEQAWETARQWSHAAIDALQQLPDGPVRRALTAFADAVVTRDA